jgi:DNA-binding transcriptional regulator of glucitol operon
MSLKALHIVFVTSSILLCFFLGGWLMENYQRSKDVTDIIFGVISWLVACTLIWYAKAILRKLRQISYL